MIRRARAWWTYRSETAAAEFVEVITTKAPLWFLVSGLAVLIVVVAALQVARWLS